MVRSTHRKTLSLLATDDDALARPVHRALPTLHSSGYARDYGEGIFHQRDDIRDVCQSERRAQKPHHRAFSDRFGRPGHSGRIPDMARKHRGIRRAQQIWGQQPHQCGHGVFVVPHRAFGLQRDVRRTGGFGSLLLHSGRNDHRRGYDGRKFGDHNPAMDPRCGECNAPPIAWRAQYQAVAGLVAKTRKETLHSQGADTLTLWTEGRA
mmetsp:Transcript_22455/g.36269  ORF Transcript_22455/g.36269 Transcript_22455/m.36269 type:complete len:208 (-) Transcript_22455:1161-1784(-)